MISAGVVPEGHGRLYASIIREENVMKILQRYPRRCLTIGSRDRHSKDRVYRLLKCGHWKIWNATLNKCCAEDDSDGEKNLTSDI